jgi:type I restriction enzyme S subunit
MGDEEKGAVTIEALLAAGALTGHKDGNHGSQYPRVEEFGSVGVPFLTAKSLSDGRIDIEGAPRLADERADSLRLGFVQPGDVLLSHNATVGRVAVVPNFTGRVLIGTSLTYFRVDLSRISPRYLAAYFSGSDFQNQLAAVMSQSTRNQVPITAQRRLHVVLPPLAEQRAIAHILGTLDDKIELNRRMNETLEAMARALFKSWFVDFDPVRAKAEGRSTGLPKPVADLFPPRLIDSELGEIPEGWEVLALPRVIEVNPTRPLRKGEVAPYLDMANMPTRGHTPDAVVDRRFGSGMRFTNGDTLVARITPCLENGKTAFVDFLEDGQIGWGSTEYIVLRPKEPLPLEFAYCLARGSDFRDFAIQSMTGSSGRQRVPAESLEHLLLAISPEPIARLFGRTVGPLFARASNAAAESRNLAALRDALLPTLISGEVRLSGAFESGTNLESRPARSPIDHHLVPGA